MTRNDSWPEATEDLTNNVEEASPDANNSLSEVIPLLDPQGELETFGKDSEGGKSSSLVSHKGLRYGKTGLLLVNLGTPDGTGYFAIRRYLSQFLSDRRVIELSPLLWQPLLQLVILSTRPFRSGKAYAKVWMNDINRSPLLHYTEQQASLLASRLSDDTNVIVEYAMRYGNPSIESKLGVLKEQGCDRISVIALYPQYSAATTASVYDEVFRVLGKFRWQPALRTASPFHDDQVYIQSLVNSVKRGLKALSFRPERILTSYHGIPQSYFLKGDPYHCHCFKTSRLLAEQLGVDQDYLRVTFQSRFGPTKWLTPYTDKVLEELPSLGIRRVAVATPSFLSDCLETLEEIAIEGKKTFLEAGGEDFAVLPCLNDSSDAIDLLEHLASRELSGF